MLNWSLNRTGSVPAASIESGVPPVSDFPPSTPVPEKPKRSKIALALGGGAARGWSHIGVLRALDEAGIEVSMIAGTSIGALVGGCYLAGKLDELENFARSLTMRRMVGFMDFAIGGGGLFGGLRLTRRMTEHLSDVRIENMDRAFVAVASELNTGHEVWVNSGSLITGMRASYALPGIFEPVKCNNRTLVDGALVNPVPVSVCRSYEERLVVAVNLNYDLYGRSAVVKHSASDPVDVPRKQKQDAKEAHLGLTNVMVQAFNIIQDRISRARMAGDPPDLSLQPRLSDIGMSEFHRADETIRRGYEETKSKISEIVRMQEVLFA